MDEVMATLMVGATAIGAASVGFAWLQSRMFDKAFPRNAESKAAAADAQVSHDASLYADAIAERVGPAIRVTGPASATRIKHRYQSATGARHARSARLCSASGKSQNDRTRA